MPHPTDREIKFRQLVFGKWHYFGLSKEGDNCSWRGPANLTDPIDQFTGWSVGETDVYENDVVDFAMFDCSERGLILWDKDRGNFAFKSSDGELYGINQREVERNVTVIGSVHEYPDLLTQESND